MDVIIDKLNKGRKNVLEYVKNDYDISDVPVFTEKEIEKIYDNRDGDKDLFDILGSAYALTLNLKHNKIPSHMMRIIFLNFAPFGRDPTKVSSKTLKEKIIAIYDNYFNEFDSLIIVIPESINEGLLKSINDINLHFQNDIKEKDLTDEIMSEMKKIIIFYRKNIFKMLHYSVWQKFV